MVNCIALLLNIQPDAHLCGAADQHADTSGVHIFGEFELLIAGICVVNKGNLFFGNSFFDELRLDVLINADVLNIFFSGIVLVGALRSCFLVLSLWCCEIAEHELRSATFLCAFPDVVDVVDAHGDFAAVLIGKRGVDHALRVRGFAPVGRNLEHIVLVRVNSALGDRCSAFVEIVYVFLHIV